MDTSMGIHVLIKLSKKVTIDRLQLLDLFLPISANQILLSYIAKAANLSCNLNS